MSKDKKSKVSGKSEEEVAKSSAASSEEAKDAGKDIDEGAGCGCDSSCDCDDAAVGAEGASGAQDSEFAENAESAEDGVEDALAEAQAEIADLKDKYLRLHAEWDTYRRRTNEQRANEKALATEKLVNEILPVLDDFERTINYATENGEAGLLDGVRAVQTKLHGVLEKSGLVQLNPEGEAFDALQHQAVATVEDAEAFDETVHEVYQKGYKMGNKVLRPAMVTVTTGGPKRPAEDDNPEGEDE